MDFAAPKKECTWICGPVLLYGIVAAASISMAIVAPVHPMAAFRVTMSMVVWDFALLFVIAAFCKSCNRGIAWILALLPLVVYLGFMIFKPSWMKDYQLQGYSDVPYVAVPEPPPENA